MRAPLCCLLAVALASPALGQRANYPPLVAPIYPNCPPATTWPGGTPVMPNPMTTGTTDPLAPQTPNALDGALRDGAFSRSGEAGGLAAATAAPGFDGDFAGVTYSRQVVTETVVRQEQIGVQQVVTVENGRKVVTDVPIFRDVLVPVTRVVRLPVISRYNGIKISENDGPRPTDRAYFGYNYYNGLNSSLNPGYGRVDLHRETAGFEKTFLNGDASFGMRLPFSQTTGPAGANNAGVGDLSFLFKYALYNNRETGDLFSAGLVLTTPTGSNPSNFIDGSAPPSSWLFQTWVGFVKNFDRSYVQGISSLVTPTDSRDPTIFWNSVAFGYWLVRNRPERVISGIIPTVEFHVTTPLNQRDPRGDVFVQDQVNMTSGVHFRTGRGTFSPAISVPLVSPTPWRVEFMLNYNLLF